MVFELFLCLLIGHVTFILFTILSPRALPRDQTGVVIVVSESLFGHDDWTIR